MIVDFMGGTQAQQTINRQLNTKLDRIAKMLSVVIERMDGGRARQEDDQQDSQGVEGHRFRKDEGAPLQESS